MSTSGFIYTHWSIREDDEEERLTNKAAVECDKQTKARALSIFYNMRYKKENNIGTNHS